MPIKINIFYKGDSNPNSPKNQEKHGLQDAWPKIKNVNLSKHDDTQIQNIYIYIYTYINCEFNHYS